MKELCSVIVPVYNEEKNIYNCIDTLAKQTYQNYEVIFVNDGSIDTSKEILEEIIKINKKFRLINQENAGAASARKNGIHQAKGEYIAILDCDDELSPDAIYNAMNAFSDNIDIVLFDLKYQEIRPDNSRRSNNFNYFTDETLLTGEAALESSLVTWGVHGLGIYRKYIFLESYKMYENYNLENYINNDEIITRLCFMNSLYIYRSEGIYFYNHNQQSTTKRINQNLYKKIYNSIILYHILLQKKPKLANVSLIISYTWEAFCYFRLHKSELGNSKEWWEAITQGVGMIQFKDKFLSLNFKEKIKYLLLVIVGFNSL